MSTSTLSKDGYLKEPGTSREDKQQHDDSDMELEDVDKLLEDKEDEIPSSQKPHNQNEQKHKTREPNKPTNNRKRHYNQIAQPEIAIKSSEKAIESLKRHTEKGTCPPDFKYKARANIKADEDFKSDIKNIRKKAEQDFVRALTRYHFRQIDRLKKTISSGKKPKDRNNSTVSSNNSKKAKQSEPEGHALNETVNNLNLIADNLLEKTEAINQMYLRIQDMSNKLNEKYTGLFSDSNNNNRAKGKSTPNKKRKERRRIKTKNFKIHASRRISNTSEIYQIKTSRVTKSTY